jgi:hypothetical protein
VRNYKDKDDTLWELYSFFYDFALSFMWGADLPEWQRLNERKPKAPDRKKYDAAYIAFHESEKDLQAAREYWASSEHGLVGEERTACVEKILEIKKNMKRQKRPPKTAKKSWNRNKKL